LRALERACRLRLSLAAGRDLVFVSVFDAALNADIHFLPTGAFLDLFLRLDTRLSRLVLILYIYEDLNIKYLLAFQREDNKFRVVLS
jgi:hypothetical protein